MNSPTSKKRSFFDAFATKVARATGTTWAFVAAFTIVLLWAISGPMFNYSDNWQLVINTGTTIITFLMVFLIQKAQNKDSLAIQLKLNELVASHKQASNRLIDVEDLTEEEMLMLEQFYVKLAQLSKADKTLHRSHSVDEAMVNHAEKSKS